MKGITGKEIKEAVKWLRDNECGCFHHNIGYTEKYKMHICIGWHDYGDGPKEKGYAHWVVAWKIGMESYQNAMQCDFDMDFFMPYDEATGEVYDTLQEIEEGTTEWDALAAEMNKAAEEVYAFQLGQEGITEADAAA